MHMHEPSTIAVRIYIYVDVPWACFGKLLSSDGGLMPMEVCPSLLYCFGFAFVRMQCLVASTGCEHLSMYMLQAPMIFGSTCIFLDLEAPGLEAAGVAEAKGFAEARGLQKPWAT